MCIRVVPTKRGEASAVDGPVVARSSTESSQYVSWLISITPGDQPWDVAVSRGRAFTNRPLFGTYSKKIGMWLFLLSDSLTFGALLYAYTYGRVSTPNWPTPFHSESIRNATFMTAFLLTSSLTMVFAVRAAALKDLKAQRLWLLATMACGLGFVILHGREWTNLIAEGLSLPVFPLPPDMQARPNLWMSPRPCRSLPPLSLA